MRQALYLIIEIPQKEKYYREEITRLELPNLNMIYNKRKTCHTILRDLNLFSSYLIDPCLS
uniref:Uncharacterized protein n=1 Tax=Arion vulgaris TaxID=1028688 RepID=A0A0B6Z6T1_9EUPU